MMLNIWQYLCYLDNCCYFYMMYFYQYVSVDFVLKHLLEPASD